MNNQTKYFNPYKQFNGVFIPDWLMSYDGCSIPAKMLYAVLTRFAGKDGYCYPGQQTLADKLQVSKRSIRTHITELQDANLIEKKRVGMGKTNRYYFVYQPELMKDEVRAENISDHPDRPENIADQERKQASDQERKISSCPINKDRIESDCKENQEERESAREDSPEEDEMEAAITKAMEVGRVNGCPIPETMLDESIIRMYLFYLKYFKEHYRRPKTSTETQMDLHRLDELRKEGNDPPAVIRQTIQASNKSFYPLRNFDNNNSTSSSNGHHRKSKGDKHAEALEAILS